MKWSLLGLVSVGLVAAFCAAILVAYVPRSSQVQAVNLPTEVKVIQAAHDLERGVVVVAEDIVTRSIPAESAPYQTYHDPVEVIGKVLAVSMTRGQAFTESCFPVQGDGLQVAGKLPAGMRAVSLSISESSGLRGLLYPGSAVDILVSLKSSPSGGQVSTTLLEGVQVLAVDEQTVFSKKSGAENQPKADKPKQMLVTVLVDSNQAQKLQLAITHGTLSLALRNPRDNIHAELKPTRLDTLVGNEMPEPETRRPNTAAANAPEQKNDQPQAATPRRRVTVIQGTKTEEVGLAVPE